MPLAHRYAGSHTHPRTLHKGTFWSPRPPTYMACAVALQYAVRAACARLATPRTSGPKRRAASGSRHCRPRRHHCLLLHTVARCGHPCPRLPPCRCRRDGTSASSASWSSLPSHAPKQCPLQARLPARRGPALAARRKPQGALLLQGAKDEGESQVLLQRRYGAVAPACQLPAVWRCCYEAAALARASRASISATSLSSSAAPPGTPSNSCARKHAGKRREAWGGQAHGRCRGRVR